MYAPNHKVKFVVMWILFTYVAINTFLKLIVMFSGPDLKRDLPSSSNFLGNIIQWSQTDGVEHTWEAKEHDLHSVLYLGHTVQQMDDGVLNYN